MGRFGVASGVAEEPPTPPARLLTLDAGALRATQQRRPTPPSRVVLQLGDRSGLGLFISKEGPGPFVITGLIQGGAAHLSGNIRVGDLVHAIGTTSLYELSEQQAKALIRGTPGPSVTLWIARAQDHLDSTPRNIDPEVQVRLKNAGLSAFTPYHLTESTAAVSSDTVGQEDGRDRSTRAMSCACVCKERARTFA